MMSSRYADAKGQAGLTLIELVIAMVVVSVAVGGVLLVMNYATSHSADPVLQRQALAIAESYLEEIALQNYHDPDADGEGNRALYDDVDDYDGLHDAGVRDQNGVALPGLAGYTVDVAVRSQSFGPSGRTVPGLEITVEVTDPAGDRVSLSSFRSDY